MRPKHTKAIDRLAADICWAEFPRRPKDTTKRAYWAGVHPDRKAEYIADARWLVFMSCRLSQGRVMGLTSLWEAVFPTDGAPADPPKVRTPTEVDA